MLAASFFSLIMPGVEVLEAAGNSAASAAAVMALAVLLGAGGIAAMNRFAPVDHLVIGQSGDPDRMMRRIWLFVIAITLHNFPEGMAVGVSFGGGDFDQGLATAVGIGVQNMPEGLAVAASLATLGYGRVWSFLGALATGLVEPLGGLLGVLVGQRRVAAALGPGAGGRRHDLRRHGGDHPAVAARGRGRPRHPGPHGRAGRHDVPRHRARLNRICERSARAAAVASLDCSLRCALGMRKYSSILKVLIPSAQCSEAERAVEDAGASDSGDAAGCSVSRVQRGNADRRRRGGRRRLAVELAGQRRHRWVRGRSCARPPGGQASAASATART
jgi:hypothetical protein